MTRSTVESRPNSLTKTGSGRGAVGLLVSVRSAEEAATALAGGASVIDIKEPAHGPLGAASVATIRSIVERVDEQAPVTAALGELVDAGPLPAVIPGLSALKVGLAGLTDTDWRARFVRMQSRFSSTDGLVPAAYADAERAGSPPAMDVLRFAIENALSWMVLDTWDKSAGNLFEMLPADEIASLLEVARQGRVNVVLAGSLRGEAIDEACRLKPALVGIRGAACVSGRGGTLAANLVRNLAQQVDRCRLAP